jgi:hypothetical protein
MGLHVKALKFIVVIIISAFLKFLSETFHSVVLLVWQAYLMWIKCLIVYCFYETSLA